MLILFLLLGLLIIPAFWLLKDYIHSLHTGFIALIYPLIGTLLAIYAIGSKVEFNSHVTWISKLDINWSFRLDGLSLIFFTLISVIGLLVIFYSIFYMSKKENLPRFYSFLMLFMLAMYGVVLANNTIILYIFWEMTSISSFLLISFWYKKDKSREGALKSFLITVFGGMMMLLGFIALYVLTGTNQIDELIRLSGHIVKGNLFYFAMVMILLGALTKSAQFPFHIWLPDAMEAPTPVSAFLHSATMVKAGIYLLLRFLPIFSGEPLFQWVLILNGLITMLVGSIFAVRQTDLKGLLAYSTISQLGMIVSMIGLASFDVKESLHHELVVLSLTACLLHIINHAVFKAALFMGTGIVDHAAHTRDLNKLGGLRKVLPITFIVMTIAAASMAGIPLLNGFLSKELFFTVLSDSRTDGMPYAWLLIALGVIASIGTFLYSIVMIARTFFGERHIREVDGEARNLTVAPLILSILVIMLFFIPNVVLKHLITPAINSILSYDTEGMIKPISAWHGFNLPLWMTLTVFIIGTLLFMTNLYKKIYPKRKEILLNVFYRETLLRGDAVSHLVIKRIMSDRLNHYLMILFAVILIITLPLTLYVLINEFTIFEWQWPSLYSIILTLFIVAALCALIFVQSRMTATILTGAVGYGVSVIYIYMHAPDLALTQLVIETITTVLFLTCFYHLPDLEAERKSRLNKIVSISIAAGVSILVMTLLLMSGDYELFESISKYYENAYELAGGKNIVNAILGDFRAFDTLLEGVVLLITGLGIFTLIRRPKRGGRELERK
ncbi:hydrogen gas-evolving membrane-bound hydrogenase subunit E [Macrococcus lamae]|uniref:DUF4040 domain-containing protein n=1 Tax=Macrococcus lamae TaxID=198484 RepID=A0A4R6BWC9_9STAP|nr:hydrogen gas-evolving membrane-bound hydrogenase subunit E [Macrococcus lamae]TDM12754.1 DUF4040 domain-containing protein [Macrococcus lamae]